MSTNSTTVNSSYDEEAIAQLINRVEDLEATVADQADRIDGLEATVEEQQATINDQADEIEELRQQLDNERDRRSAEVEGCHNRITNEISEIDATDGREGGSSTDNPEGQDEETTALERICALPEHVVEDNLTRNQQRARSITQLVEEIGKSVPAGIAITSSRIKRALSAREDTTIHRQTVKRVADFLKRFGDGGVKIKETRGGKTTVVFDEELATAVTGVVTDDGRGGVTPAVI